MKLLTHNMLTSNIIKNVTKGYPLTIVPKTVEVKEVDFNAEFVARMIPKVDWGALKQAAEQVGKAEECPAEVAPEYESDEEFLKKAHHLLLEVEVKDADLVCPESGRKFPVSNGIPNMLLNEDEGYTLRVLRETDQWNYWIQNVLWCRGTALAKCTARIIL